jgi:hypothetical protein
VWEAEQDNKEAGNEGNIFDIYEVMAVPYIVARMQVKIIKELINHSMPWQSRNIPKRK